MAKFVKLNENTRVLLNEAKSHILEEDPKINKLTDTIALYKVLIEYNKARRV